MKGYKVFHHDWTCRGFKYKVGDTYTMKESPVPCRRGFHFCKNLADCFSYYDFDPTNKVAEVEAVGEVVTGVRGKSCTNMITIVKEMTWKDVLRIVNAGMTCKGLENTGYGNAGSYNTGNGNIGDYNTGNNNIGDYNTGDYNPGSYNTGSRNTGDHNTGECNAGDYNTGNGNFGSRNSGQGNTGLQNTGDWNNGDCNTGECNVGECNTGECNFGDQNTGNSNAGSWNSGDWNTGNSNTGDCNTGDCNTGNCNTGKFNSGDWNTTFGSSGCFCTEEENIRMFNRPSEWTLKDWRDSKACHLLSELPSDVAEWVSIDEMTDEEIQMHPEHEMTGGYLRALDGTVNAQNWWDGLSDDRKEIIKSIPNFDPEIFKECTGIDVEKNNKKPKA